MNSAAKIFVILSIGMVLEASLIYTGIYLGTVNMKYEYYLIVLLIIAGIVLGYLSYINMSKDKVSVDELARKLALEIYNNINILTYSTEIYPLLSTESYISAKNSRFPTNNLLDLTYNMIYIWNQKGMRTRTQSTSAQKLLQLPEKKERKDLLNMLNRAAHLFNPQLLQKR